jgi:hypothetical protein
MTAARERGAERPRKERPEHLWGRPVADPGIGYWDVVLRLLGPRQNLSVPSNLSGPRTTHLAQAS